MNTNEIKREFLLELKENAMKLEDKREYKKITYKIWDIVVVAVLAVLADCNEWEEIEDFAIANKPFLRKFLKLTGGIPNAITYKRVISIIDPKELNKIFIDFITIVQYSKKTNFKEILSFDGKVDRGSSRKKGAVQEGCKPLNVLNVYSDKYGMCIEQEVIEDKTNEITAIPKVIERLNLKGVICTCDALNTQKENVAKVIEKGGDYCFALKMNHLNFYNDVKDYFDDDKLLILQSGYEGGYILEIEKSHSNIIKYEYYQTENIKWYTEIKEWKKLRSIGMVKKTIKKPNGEEVIECRYYISSLLINIHEFAYSIRAHWNVENKLHWHLDFTFKCDNNTTKDKNALFNLQLIKKFTLKILNIMKIKKKKSLKRIRKDIARNTEKEMVEIFEILRNFDTSVIS